MNFLTELWRFNRTGDPVNPKVRTVLIQALADGRFYIGGVLVRKGQKARIPAADAAHLEASGKVRILGDEREERIMQSAGPD